MAVEMVETRVLDEKTEEISEITVGLNPDGTRKTEIVMKDRRIISINGPAMIFCGDQLLGQVLIGRIWPDRMPQRIKKIELRSPVFPGVNICIKAV